MITGEYKIVSKNKFLLLFCNKNIKNIYVRSLCKKIVITGLIFNKKGNK